MEMGPIPPVLKIVIKLDSSVHGILQARILEWVAISFSRGSSQPRDRTQVSHIAGRCFNLCTTREAPVIKLYYIKSYLKGTGFIFSTLHEWNKVLGSLSHFLNVGERARFTLRVFWLLSSLKKSALVLWGHMSLYFKRHILTKHIWNDET